MTLSVFPDTNVWVALAFDGHAHHHAATRWFDSIEDQTDMIFCRFTQLGFLRLLTHASVMGDRVKTQREAWEIYDVFVRDGNARMMPEPHQVESRLRTLARLDSASPQAWADSYLAVFAETAMLTLVTFDKALARRVEGATLLRG